MLSDDILLKLVELVGDTMVELRVKFFDDRGKQLTETLVSFVVRCQHANLGFVINDARFDTELDIAAKACALFLAVGPDVSC